MGAVCHEFEEMHLWAGEGKESDSCIFFRECALMYGRLFSRQSGITGHRLCEAAVF